MTSLSSAEIILAAFLMAYLTLTRYAYLLTAQQAKNSKDFCFVVLRQYTRKFVFHVPALA